MRKLAISLALASTALASPALARDDQWYVGVDGGVMLVEDTDLNLADGGSTAITSGFDEGYDFGGVVGYDFGAFRLESEVSYRAANIDSHQVNVVAPGFYENGNAFGKASALSFMVNGLLDFGADDGLQGFVGGGVGVARVALKDFGIVAGGTALTALDDSDTGFAWQALAGIRAPLSDSWDVGLKYRFFNAPNVDLIATGPVAGAALETRYRSHSLMGSLVYNFGGAPAPVETPPPPPPAPVDTPPPPPPPPPAQTCNSGPYIVFFDWDKSDLTSQGASTLDNAVSNYGSCGNARVMLAGHADRSGATSYNVGLSQRRNATVRAYLSSKGVSDGVISTEALGESQNLVATADGVREPQNRRVEVSYGPGSGN